MPLGIFLINGVSLPYHVIDAAIHWAGQNQASLLGVFIFGDQRHAESYEFPSDIEKVQTLVSEQQGEKDIEALVRGNRQYAENQGKLKGVVIQTVSFQDPKAVELRVELQKATVLFTDPATFKGADEYACTSFTFKDIVSIFPNAIEVHK